MDPKKIEQLTAFLGVLPPLVAARLAKAIEIDKLTDGKALPHEMILDGLRPVLRKNQSAERAFTPLRLFCRPFEDLLTMQPRREKQKGRVARSSIMPVWNWVSQTLVPEEANSFSIGVKTAVMSGRSEEALKGAAGFWTVAAQAILSALDNDRGRKAARTVLENDLVISDAREMALLLVIGDDIVDLQKRVPRPLPSLTDEYIWTLREVYDRVAASAPDSAPYIAVVAMQRLERPWEALKLPQNITRQSGDTLISSTDMGLVGEILFGDIEMYASAIRNTRQQSFDADTLISHLANFTTLSTGMVKAIEMRRDGKWGQRLLKDRTAVAEVMDGFMEKAEKEVMSALPTVKSGSYAGGPRVPDLSHGCDPEKSSRAITYAKLVSGCRAFAAAASIGASNKEAIDAISIALKSYNEDLLRDLRAAEGDRRIHAEQYFNLSVEISSLVFSSQEAEFLRRRGRAAMPVAA